MCQYHASTLINLTINGLSPTVAGATITSSAIRRAVTNLANGRIIEADTLEELAEKLNKLNFKGSQTDMDAAVLVETVVKYNGYLKSGVDEEFGREITDAMLPIENAPFYAVAAWPSVHHTMGGITINASAQVLDTDGEVIPNLYAAGEVSGGVQ